MAPPHGDSPTRPRHTHSAQYRSIHVADSRKTLTRDIPEVPEVHLDSLMDAVLPSVPSDGLDVVYDTLVAAGHIQGSDNNDPRWRCLPQDPSVGGKEAETFKFLEGVAEAIVNSHVLEASIHVRLKITGEVTPLSNRRNTSRPDGFFHILKDTENTHEDTEAATEGTGGAKWDDIIMPMEFKNVYNAQSKIDDIAKVMWSMHHVMRNDPRRRHVLGLTCEDTKARLWYNDRADVVASKEFDVNKDWKCLVRIILSVLLGSPTELGYDPTITAVEPIDGNSEPSYDISIYNAETRTTTVYRTIGIISDAGADSMVGRGTRVWKVRKLIDGRLDGPTYALKDVWVYGDRDPEDVVLRKIRKEHPERAQFFLTPIDHGFAPLDLTRPEILDNTHNTLGRPRKLKPTRVLLRTNAGSISGPLTHTTSKNGSQGASSVPRDSVGHSNAALNLPQRGHRTVGHLCEHPRQHYRIVFKEIGRPIHDLRNFTDIFAAIEGGWEGLHAMHLGGYVHRDVSSGNILLVPASSGFEERGVIMDLEYAKDTEDTSAPHDVKTGTAAFMATEVAVAQHHRLRSLRQEAQTAAKSLDALDSLLMSTKTAPKPLSLPPFRHNPLHDMESIWWLCVWLMFFYLVPSDCSGERTKQQVKNHCRVFESPPAKQNFFCEQGVFEELTAHFSNPPPFVEPMRSWLDALNQLYRFSYENQDTLIPLNRLRVDTVVIQKAYDYGRGVLAELKGASEPLPDWVTLSERSENLATIVTPSRSSHLTFDGVHPPPAKKHRTK